MYVVIDKRQNTTETIYLAMSIIMLELFMLEKTPTFFRLANPHNVCLSGNLTQDLLTYKSSQESSFDKCFILVEDYDIADLKQKEGCAQNFQNEIHCPRGKS